MPDDHDENGRYENTRWDGLFRVGFYAGLALVVFLAGAIVVIGNYPPGPQIRRAYEGGMAYYAKLQMTQDVYFTDLWFKAVRSEKGVTVYDKDKAEEGLTLYTSGHAPAAWLIDMQGAVVQEWRRPFSTVWQAGDGGPEHPQPDDFVHFRQARAFPNGDLIALYEGAGDTPYGYGMVKLDRNSEIIWKYTGRAHHQFDISPDGNIYVLTHAIVDQRDPSMAHLATPRIEDYLVILSSGGRELKKIPLLKAFGASKYRQLVYAISHFSRADPLHANSIVYITPELAKNFPFGKAGQVLISFRETHAVAVIDPDSGQVSWASKGPWMGQHDADLLPDGNILLFDNFGNFDGPDGMSRVIEFNPATMEIVWEYKGTAKDPLMSPIRADQQRLKNGNTLIDDSSAGRLIEITEDGDLVWEFLNPVRGGQGNVKMPVITWAERLDADWFDEGLMPDKNKKERAP